jgi:hypothetical protein
MHYRTPRVSFLEPADAFLEQIPAVQRLDTPAFDTSEFTAAGAAPLAVVPAAP